jgi:hypothetical protein
MTVNTYPLDTAVIVANTESVVALDPVVDFDTGEQRRDRNGVLRWKLTVVYNDPASYRRELLEIGFASATAPEAGAGDELVMTGLSGRPWQRQNAYGFNSGFSVSAETVAFRPRSRRSSEPAAA